MEFTLTAIDDLFTWQALSKCSTIYSIQSVDIGQIPEDTPINFWVYDQNLKRTKIDTTLEANIILA